MSPSDEPLDYGAAMDVLVNQTGVISLLPLEAMRENVERTESVGFLFVAPFDYTRGLAGLRHQRAVIDAAIALRDALKSWRDEVHGG